MKWPFNMSAVNSYVRILLDDRNWDRLMEVLQYEADYDDKNGTSHPVKFFLKHEFLPDIGFACRAKSHPEFIIEALRQTLREIEKAGDTSKLIDKLFTFGDFCYDYYDRDNEALCWWEEALSRIGQANSAIQRA
jgi:hypothetical protein